MLKSLDVLLGLAVVMLVASMAVTVLTQIWTALFNTRGVHLREGLTGLLRQIHADFTPADANRIADAILTHPLVHSACGRLGSLIHRDEFTRLLLELASGDSPRKLPELTRQALTDALAANGIADPAGTLRKIRECALNLEISHPALAAHARHDLAILEGAASDFVAKINSGFERSIERISARFTLSARHITMVNALLVAAAVQLDSAALINRLASDDALRGTLVQQAVAKSQVAATSVDQINLLTGQHIFIPPSDWLAEWRPSKIPGIALSALLLTLGAPFWFEALKDLLRLRDAAKPSGL